MSQNTLKREHDEGSTDVFSPSVLEREAVERTTLPTTNSTTNFRNVSACNRCRTRKNRCDQKLPRCTGCEKARVKCVGFDPVSKRTIPRSYVYYLETRLQKLEQLLEANHIPFEPPESDFSISDAIRPGVNVPFPVEEENEAPEPRSAADDDSQLTVDPSLTTQPNLLATNAKLTAGDASAARDVRSNNDGKDSHRNAGISFAKVVFAAVRSTAPHSTNGRGARKPSTQIANDSTSGSTSARDSFFGLHTRPTVSAAPFPSRDVANDLIDLYFQYANAQIPIIHRVEFMSLSERVYSSEPASRNARALYLLNIVFAIGSGIIVESSGYGQSERSEDSSAEPKSKRSRHGDRKAQPEEYHAAAVAHMESFVDCAPTFEGGGGGIEELQAVCLLASLALLRPVAPGLWYIIGVAVRLAVDLGLHSEDAEQDVNDGQEFNGPKTSGRKQWTRDLRRRLWWCVYSLDRLVSTCVGRPFGITDQVITTEFPSMFDDRYICRDGFEDGIQDAALPSYKLIAHHYFRLRLLQSEILQVLQHRQAEQARSRGANRSNSYIHKALISPFMGKFTSFQEWRLDVDHRLWQWKQSAPRQEDTGVAFTPLFLELNYWQAVILLYRQSLAVPEQLADLETASASSDVLQSPGTVNERQEDEQMVLLKVAQAGQTVLKLYRQLHRLKLVNYTYLATHHLFMSGISFLYAIWHSPLVRSRLTLDDVDFTILIATSVLGDLSAKCPPAETCRDAFSRMAKATIAMVEKTTGFGSASTLSMQPLNLPRSRDQSGAGGTDALPQKSSSSNVAGMPHFDMDLKALFSQDELLAQQFKLHTSSHRDQHADAGAVQQALSRQQSNESYQGASYNTNHQHTPAMHSVTPSSSHREPRWHSQQASQYSIQTSPTLPQMTPFRPIKEAAIQSQPNFTNDADMSFLDTFPISFGQSDWEGDWNNADMSLGFATGGTGTAWDSGGDWTGMGGGVDMFDGFFFGEGTNGNGSGGYG